MNAAAAPEPGGRAARPAPPPKRPRGRTLRQDLLALPNQLTLLRLLLCIAFFGVLIYCSEALKLPVDAEGQLHYARVFRGDVYEAHAGLHHPGASGLTLLLNGAFCVFVLAALTDIADGKIARAYNLETDLGRIADPFVDKIMILGSFTLLIPLTVHVMGWMVVLILGRELFVSAIRGFVEARGIAFGASWSGKAKMFLQSCAVGASLVYLGHPSTPWIKWTFIVLLWSALVSTVLSGVLYGVRAKRLLFPDPGVEG